MKFLFKVKKSLMFVTLLLAFCSVYAISETYTLDPRHTTVSWSVKHLGFSNFSGKYFATGTLIYDESSPANSQVNATIQIKSGSTGLPELDTHIAGNAFLDYRKYPNATFVSKKVTMTGTKTGNVDGILTIHGVALPVTLKVLFNKVGISKINDKKTAGFSATTTINRSDFGVTIFLPEISDEVKLTIEVEATLTSTQP